VEELYGRGRMRLLFWLTGVLANLGAMAVGVHGVGIGASGAIMGLIGLAAGWGQRDGTGAGRNVRNMMLKWAAYVMVFGYVIGADNAAHLIGFLAGGLAGFSLRPSALRRSERLWLQVLQALTGAGLALAMLVLCLVPPASAVQAQFEQHFVSPDEHENPYAFWLEICALERDGKVAEALARFQAMIPPEADLPEEALPSREQLRAACQSFETQREQCRKYRAEGVDALIPPGQPELDQLDRIDFERAMRSTCDWLGE